MNDFAFLVLLAVCAVVVLIVFVSMMNSGNRDLVGYPPDDEDNLDNVNINNIVNDEIDDDDPVQDALDIMTGGIAEIFNAIDTDDDEQN